MPILTGKVALITGGGSGIGAAAVAVFVREGAAVVVADRDVVAGQAVATSVAEQGGRALFVEVDVADAQSVSDMIVASVATFGRIDCAFNNAGVPDRSTSVLTPDQANWDRVMATNLEGLWHCLRLEIEQMLAQGTGTIVNNASRSALVGIPTDAIYGAAKHGVIGLTRAAAVEFAGRGVRVNAICPGLVETPLTRERFGDRLTGVAANANPLGRMAQAREIAEAAAWLCSDASSFVVGIALPIDGGATAR
jgi:NAD(P)-dependent dehydrogenase (short-subunit alcohol dehydrogenase family)